MSNRNSIYFFLTIQNRVAIVCFMKKIPLEKYLSTPGNTQTGLAKKAGLTQGAIFQMVRAGRNIFVIPQADGSVELEEVKRLGAA